MWIRSKLDEQALEMSLVTLMSPYVTSYFGTRSNAAPNLVSLYISLSRYANIGY
jgi:hypothetical protein